MDIYENHRKWLRYWVKQFANDDRAVFERTYGYTRSQISQFLSETYNEGRSIGYTAARRLEERLGQPTRIMDMDFDALQRGGDHELSPETIEGMVASLPAHMTELYIPPSTPEDAAASMRLIYEMSQESVPVLIIQAIRAMLETLRQANTPYIPYIDELSSSPESSAQLDSKTDAAIAAASLGSHSTGHEDHGRRVDGGKKRKGR